MKKLNRILLMCILMVFATGLVAQQMPPVPMDPKIRFGKLDNGLTYYIRHNQLPKERAEFYIAQNVGAILEEDHQNGLAHFLEHMAFNGTKNFPGKMIIEYFEKIGVKFGSNINAYTSLDETVYNLSDVPTNREGIIDSALLVLHDWSGFISLLEEEIDSERGVIREEWRTGAGADRRMWKASNFQKYPGSQYAKRDVIGDTAVINNFSYQALRDYYQKWYRPDQQAIVIVGDINVDQIEAKIKKLYSNIPAPVNPAERIIYPIYDNQEPIISRVRDREARMTRIELEYKHDVLPDQLKLSMAGYMMGVVNSIVSTVMGYRFEEITQRADAPFVGGYAQYGELFKSKDAFQMLVVPREGQELKGLQALLMEAEKFRRFGLTASEVERAKTDILKSLENAYNDRENQRNRDLVREYVRHFLSQEVIPGIEWEFNTFKMMMPHITADVINQATKSYVRDENLIVSFMAPDKENVIIPSDSEVLSAIAGVKTAEIAAPVEEDMNKPLLSVVPKAGKLKKTTVNKAMTTTEWVLSNGIRVVFRPTEFKKDEILMTSFSEGGISKVKDLKDMVSATLAVNVVTNNGVGDYSLVELNKVLTGKIASVSPSIGMYDEGFSGKSSVADFETMMQLVYLYFTAPRKDDDAFAALVNMYKASLGNIASDPRKSFSDSVNLMINNRHPRTVLLSLEAIDKLNQERALAIFKERFAVPADFTFIFTGNIDPGNQAVKDAVLTYLGGLKSKKGKEKLTDHKIRKPRGLVNNHFGRKMEINKASNFILYSGALPYNIENRTAMIAIGNILNMRYLESIREKEGGTYGVGVRGSLSNVPVADATVLMQFDTDPEKQQRLMKIIHQEVEEIVKNGPRADDLQKVKENMLKQYSQDLRENNWWSSALQRYYQDKLNYINEYQAAIDALNAEKIQKTLKALTDQGNVLEVVMKPTE